MNSGENLRRTVRFERPDWIPMTFYISPACWNHYPQDALQELMAAHSLLFPNFERKAKVEPQFGLAQKKGEPYTDFWGCTWTTTLDGITGTVTGHALADWESLDGFTPPSAETSDGFAPLDWTRIAERVRTAKENGRLAFSSLTHGHTFMRLCDLRGYENVIMDMVDEEPRLNQLLKMIEEFNVALVNRYVSAGADWIGFPEDLGMQQGPMLSPTHFHQYIRPVYERIMAPAREAGCIVHMHSDGDVRELLADMIGSGVEIVNLQDLVNGIDFISARLRGRVCIDLDVDRQTTVPNGTPAQIDSLIRKEVEALGSREGGLMMIHGLYPGVPLENVKALMDAMERYAGYYN